MTQLEINDMVSVVCAEMTRESLVLQKTDLPTAFAELIDMFLRIRRRISKHDSTLKTTISNHNVIVAHLSAPTAPDDTLLKSLEDELKSLQASLDETAEGIKTLQKEQEALADARARHRAEQANKQRKDRQKLTEMRSLLVFYRSISNVYWDADHRCFLLSPHKAKLIKFSAPDNKFRLSQKNDSGEDMCIWDLLDD